VVGAAVLVGALAFVFVSLDTVPDEEPTATSTPEVATTTDIFDMEPIVPEAKVSTEGWKTCRNEEYGYEFQFPGEWKIYGEDARIGPDEFGKRYLIYEQASRECNGILVILSPETVGDVPRYIEPSRSIVVERPASRFIYEDIESLAKEMARRDVEQRLAVIDGQKGLVRIRENNGIRNWSFVVWFEDSVYRLTVPKHENSVDIAETVFSTFRFLDTSTSTTAGLE